MSKEVKQACIELIKQLAQQCFDHIPASGKVHQQRNEIVANAIQELEKYDFVLKDSDIKE